MAPPRKFMARARGVLLDHPVIILYALLVLLVIVSWLYLSKDEVEKHHYVAAQALPKNWLMSIQDFDKPKSGPGAYGWFLPDKADLVGKYVGQEKIDAGKEIDEERLRSALELRLETGMRPALVSIDKQGIPPRFLNAGAIVDVFGKESKLIVAGARVHGVICVAGKAAKQPGLPSCTGILSVNESDARLIAGESDAIRLVLSERGPARTKDWSSGFDWMRSPKFWN